MKAATLFSGIGAPEAAMPHWDWLWHAEIEPFPAAVMAARHPGSVNLGDVSAPDFVERALNVGRPDVLVFGSPCQSFSVAGKRLGLDDPRGNLALVALGLARRLRPDWLVYENVPGLLSSGEGRDFAAFLSTLGECGYPHAAWGTLDAQHFGVPQRRRRIFLVANTRDWRDSAEILSLAESMLWNPAPSREAREDVAPTISARTKGGGGLGTDFDCDGGLIARSLNAHPSRSDGESETFITHALRADGFDASEDGTGRGTPLVPVMAAGCGGSNGAGIGLAGDPMFALDTTGAAAIAFTCKDHGADAGDVALTLRVMPHHGSHANAGGQVAVAFDIHGVPATNGASETAIHTPLRSRAPGGSEASTTTVVSHASAVRRLTPRECERLQGFPDDFTAIRYRGKPAADGPRYKALGNSMAVPVVRWLLTRLERIAAQRKALAA